MTDKEPFHIYTCGKEQFLGTANEDGAKWVRENGGTVVDTREPRPFMGGEISLADSAARIYCRISDNYGTQNLKVKSFRSADGTEGLKFSLTNSEKWGGLSKQTALQLASDIQEYYSEPDANDLPDWADGSKLWTQPGTGKQFRPTGEYRDVRRGDYWVNASDEETGDHFVAGPHDEIKWCLGPRIILEPVVDWPEWVDRDREYEHKGRLYKPSEYRETRVGDVFVADSESRSRSQGHAMTHDIHGNMFGPRIILKPVEMR